MVKPLNWTFSKLTGHYCAMTFLGLAVVSRDTGWVIDFHDCGRIRRVPGRFQLAEQAMLEVQSQHEQALKAWLSTDSTTCCDGCKNSEKNAPG